MNILLVEDDNEKANRISTILQNCIHENRRSDFQITHSKNIADARQHLSQLQFELMILDVRLPVRANEAPSDSAGVELLQQLFVDDEYKRPKYVVGLSGIDSLYSEASRQFHKHGWMLLKYSPTEQSWCDSLLCFVKHIESISNDGVFVPQEADVVILTALEDPEFTSIKEVFPELLGPKSLDEKTLFWEGIISTPSGNIRVVAGYSWQMGLTAAAVLAERFLSAFKPKLLAMTGICAGFESNIALGDVIVSTQSWEWQGGKIKDSDSGPSLQAAPEPYRASQSAITYMRAKTADKNFASALTKQYYPQDTGAQWKVHFGPMVSGLSVVASAAIMEEAKVQHRKMLGLEMEAYAIYAAAEFNAHNCKRIVLKGVCDFGTSEKGDNFQKKAAMRSAICLRELLMNQL